MKPPEVQRDPSFWVSQDLCFSLIVRHSADSVCPVKLKHLHLIRKLYALSRRRERAEARGNIFQCPLFSQLRLHKVELRFLPRLFALRFCFLLDRLPDSWNPPFLKYGSEYVWYYCESTGPTNGKANLYACNNRLEGISKNP